jgi:aspartate--ammonia ligase
MAQSVLLHQDYEHTQTSVHRVKDAFQRELAAALDLKRVAAPRFLDANTGLQDDLARTQSPVSFKAGETDLEVVHSLAKWKRHALARHGFSAGTGLLTDMVAIRKDEKLSPVHSLLVDQWDWERVITRQERNIDFLKTVVIAIYQALLRTQRVAQELGSKARLAREISFVHSEELLARWPTISPAEREKRIAKERGAVFVIGIGGALLDGTIHDLRAFDYDDWTLNGDIIVWDQVRQDALELSSMGIRVDAERLKQQARIHGRNDSLALPFHRAVLNQELPQTIGGGIGQSRVAMLLLGKRHIGEVQVSHWPESMRKECADAGIELL